MRFPLTMGDIRLWLALTIIIMAFTSEVLYLSKPLKNAPIPKEFLRIASVILGIAFIIIMVTSPY